MVRQYKRDAREGDPKVSRGNRADDAVRRRIDVTTRTDGIRTRPLLHMSLTQQSNPMHEAYQEHILDHTGVCSSCFREIRVRRINPY